MHERYESNVAIGDLHLKHNSICRLRKQFKNPTEHDEFVVNSLIEAGDRTKTLWLLGDNFFKPSSFHYLDEIRLAYQSVNLQLGNHDHHSIAKHVFYANQKGVKIIGPTADLGCFFTHLPVHHTDLNRGLNVHAHLHMRPLIKNVKMEIDNRYFCVSAERINYKPISIKEIYDRVNRPMTIS